MDELVLARGFGPSAFGWLDSGRSTVFGLAEVESAAFDSAVEIASAANARTIEIAPRM
jgi:hypothetical protein